MSHPDFALAESVSTTNAYYFIAVYLLVLIYCCFGLAIVCDAYFVPALQKLSYTYDLPPDIAGSTLMALGASVPELFASLIGVFVTEDDIGTGSIIGSSCFNLIAVPAACAFVASASFSRKLIVSPVPVMRNSAFYAITILVLLLIIKDNKVDIPEAIILLLFFVMYMTFMIICAQQNKGNNSSDTLNVGGDHQQHQNLLANNSFTSNDSAIAECGDKSATQVGPKSNERQQQIYGHYYFAQNNNQHRSDGYLNTSNNNTSYNKTRTSYLDERTPLVTTNKSCEVPLYHDDSYDQKQPTIVTVGKSEYLFVSEPNLLDSVSVDLGIAIKNSSCLVKHVDSLNHHGLSGQDNHHNEENSWINSYWILVPMLPLTLSMKVLSPLKFKNGCWTIWTFIVSICLIGALTYVSVWMVHLFGQQVGIPETVAGMTILSWGTGIPELIASIVLIRKTAQADMAICNTIGSNVIDASFCLSLPWLVKCMLNKANGLTAEVPIQSAALPWTSFTLFLAVLLLILILRLHNWELGFGVGVWLTITYATFVVVATYLESSFSESGLDLLSII